MEEGRHQRETSGATDVHPLRDDQPFAFAGLWESWKYHAGENVETCTIITTTPNELMVRIHDRMPVILPRAQYDRWLDPKVLGTDVADLLTPFDADKMDAHPVSSRVNVPTNQGLKLIERA